MNPALRRPLAAAALALGACLAGPSALAAVITLTPSSLSTTPGSPVTLDVRVSDLGVGNALGAFDLDVAYDQALLSFTGIAFGPSLGNPAAFEALTSVSMSGPGRIDFSEVSLLTPAQLAAAQAASFSLATLAFNAVTSGTTGFTLLGTSILSDAFGRPLPITQATPVPTPQTALLLGVGLAGLMFGVTAKRRAVRSTRRA